ncbi:hypothetical protein AKJ58_01680 [candidate division MSBL1 archaeon SCGC-AAA385D11]|uniref:SpoVT-AbrB domain-containing protein n=1 Tax=candidate division MSBL1 archaeon SCGC-AAA385D11 TaxID=1698286 RepID=A0A133VN06_9EURY|nr:hypothetical protein AKJ58_01680 [candidate division MSBL1 archaeon SCGC-AAA385D11]
MTAINKITVLGGSTGVSIPPSILDALDMERGDLVALSLVSQDAFQVMKIQPKEVDLNEYGLAEIRNE